MRIYITDKPKLAKSISQALGLLANNELSCYANDNTFVVPIAADYDIKINSTGKKLLSIDDGFEDIIITVDYKSLQDIKKIKQITKDSQSIEFINICESNPKGQLNFDIIAAVLDIGSAKRIWLKTNSIDKTVLNDIKNNEDFKNESDAKLCDIVIDLYWRYRSKLLFSKETDINLKELILLNLISTNDEDLQNDNSFDTEYYRIEAEIGSYKFKWATKSEDKIYSIEEAKDVLSNIKDKKALIMKTEHKEFIKPSPLLYNAADLYKDIQKHKLMSLKDGIKATNELFSLGYITNPNTESRHLPTSYKDKLTSILTTLYRQPQYEQFIEYIKTSKTVSLNRVVNNEFVDNTHAIIPTENIPLSNELNKIHLAVYDLIAKRFLAIFMGNTIMKKLHITAIIDSKNILKHESEIITHYGWQALNETKLDIKELVEIESQIVNKINETLNSGEQYPIINPSIIQGNPRGKSRYTVSSLITLMSNCGRNIKNDDTKVKLRHLSIGFSEDRPKIIGSLEEKGLITIHEDRKVYITNEGKKIIGNAPNTLLSFKLLESFNLKIKAIQQNKVSLSEVLKDRMTYITKIIEDIKKQENSNYELIPYDKIIEEYECPFCSCKLRDLGKFIGCTNYPRCEFSLSKEIKQYTLKEKDIVDLLTQEHKTDLIEGFTFKNGPVRKGRAKLVLNYNSRKIDFEFVNKNK